MTQISVKPIRVCVSLKLGIECSDSEDEGDETCECVGSLLPSIN